MNSRSLCLFIVLIAVLSTPILALRSNFELADSLCVVAARQVAIQINTASNVRLDLSDHAAKWLVQQALMRTFGDRQINFSDSARSLHIGIADCATRYIATMEKDSLVRTVRVELRTYFDDKVLSTSVATYSDRVARADVTSIENPKYDFSVCALPPPVRSTWDDIVEPLIIIGALATTVVLLFSVRSQ